MMTTGRADFIVVANGTSSPDTKLSISGINAPSDAASVIAHKTVNRTIKKRRFLSPLSNNSMIGASLIIRLIYNILDRFCEMKFRHK